MGDLATDVYALVSPVSQQSQGTTAPVAETKPKKKICCACPDTKRLCDEWIVEHGEDACSKWIDAHLKCLRAEGFNVSEKGPCLVRLKGKYPLLCDFSHQDGINIEEAFQCMATNGLKSGEEEEIYFPDTIDVAGSSQQRSTG